MRRCDGKRITGLHRITDPDACTALAPVSARVRVPVLPGRT
jgi:hypothetical protein